MEDALLASAVILASIVAAAVCILLFAAGLDWGHRQSHGLMPFLFYPAIGIFMLGTALSSRNLDVGAAAELLEGEKPLAVQFISKAVSLFLLFASGERIMNRMLRLEPIHDMPVILAVALWTFYLSNVVSSALLATHASFSHEYLYTAVAAYGSLLMTRREGDMAVSAVRNAMFVLLGLSAACVFWRPELVLESGYHGWIPSVQIRYYGLLSSPNGLGGAVILFMLCLWLRPFRRRWLNLTGWTLGGTSLLFAQSKTSWVAFLLCAACMTYFARSKKAETTPQRTSQAPNYKAALLLIALAGVFGVTFAFIYGNTADTVYSFFNSRSGNQLLTLVGRTPIWSVAVEEWRNNPLFGYGLTIWDSEYRARIGFPDALHAHNQFFHSLSSAGLVGVLGLTAYAAALVWFAIRTARESNGLSVAIFILILVRSISEVPLSMVGYGMEQLTHLFLLMVIASHLAPRHSTAPHFVP
jgi:exopolysaccharide production protein ExoQ